MDYDSRRWTGRYAPGERPPELGGPQAERHRYVRWMLLVIIVLTLVLTITPFLAHDGAGQTPTSPFILLSLSLVASGRSPFARGLRSDYDEFERQALLQAYKRAYAGIVGLLLVAFGWFAVASGRGWPMPRDGWHWASWAAALLVIASNLPVMLAEFAIPFPDQEDAA